MLKCLFPAQNVSLEEGCMFEPLSVAVNALAKVAEMRSNASVAIFGAGPVGLLCMAVAKALGAKRIIAIDIQQDRLDFALKYAATDIWKSTAPLGKEESKMAYARRQAEEMAKKLGIDLSQGDKAIDIVVDCTGVEVCIASGIYLARDAGTFVQVGMGAEFVQFP